MHDDNEPDDNSVYKIGPGMYPKSYILLGVLQSYAPTGSVQQQCADLYGEMQRDMCRGDEATSVDDQLVSMLAGHLKYGIDHGNWFWLNPIH